MVKTIPLCAEINILVCIRFPKIIVLWSVKTQKMLHSFLRLNKKLEGYFCLNYFLITINFEKYFLMHCNLIIEKCLPNILLKLCHPTAFHSLI